MPHFTKIPFCWSHTFTSRIDECNLKKKHFIQGELALIYAFQDVLPGPWNNSDVYMSLQKKTSLKYFTSFTRVMKLKYSPENRTCFSREWRMADSERLRIVLSCWLCILKNLKLSTTRRKNPTRLILVFSNENTTSRKQRGSKVWRKVQKKGWGLNWPRCR